MNYLLSIDIYEWPFGSLGYAPYLLSFGFLLLTISSISKFMDIKRNIFIWNLHVYFHIGLIFLNIVRTISFVILSFYYFNEPDKNIQITYYSFFTIMFTIPEFLCLIIFILLFFNWLEIFIFSHDQYTYNTDIFRKAWKSIFIIVTILYSIIQIFFYIILFANEPLDRDTTVRIIAYIIALSCIGLPAIMFCLYLYFATVSLSGYPYLSILAETRVQKINYLFLSWSIGRLLRGIFIAISLANNFESTENEFLLTFIIILSIAVTEYIPFYLSLDWSTISILLTNLSDDRSSLLLPDSISQNSGFESSIIEKHVISPQDVLITEELHDAGLSITYKATYDGNDVCVKKFQLHEISSERAIEEMAEIIVLYSNVDHPNVARFIGIYKVGPNLHVISEYMNRRSLLDLVKSNPDILTERLIIKYSKQICRAMSFLHSRRRPNPNGIIHGNLSSSNVLIDNADHVKLTDIAISKLNYHSELLSERHNGFAAPEALLGEELTPASDVYSFGMILWHMLYKKLPHEGKSKFDLRRLSSERDIMLPLLPLNNFKPEILQIVEKCCSNTQELRPTFNTLYSKFDELSIL